MYITRQKSTASLKPIGNVIVSPETLTLSVASVLTDLTIDQEASGLKQRLMVCVLSVTE
jgi:hypothetical protein